MIRVRSFAKTTMRNVLCSKNMFFGFAGEGRGTKLKLIQCESIGNVKGTYAEDRGATLECVDCTPAYPPPHQYWDPMNMIQTL